MFTGLTPQYFGGKCPEGTYGKPSNSKPETCCCGPGCCWDWCDKAFHNYLAQSGKSTKCFEGNGNLFGTRKPKWMWNNKSYKAAMHVATIGE